MAGDAEHADAPLMLSGCADLQRSTRRDDFLPLLALLDIVEGQHVEVIGVQLLQQTFQFVPGLSRRACLELHAYRNLGAACSQVGDKVAQAVRDAAPVEEVDAGVDGVLHVLRRQKGVAARRQAKTPDRIRKRGARTVKGGLQEGLSSAGIVHDPLRAHCRLRIVYWPTALAAGTLVLSPAAGHALLPSVSAMVWTQNYDPCHNVLISTLLAALPTVLLLGLLATGRVSAALAALSGLLAAVAVAILVFTPNAASAPDGPGLLDWSSTILAAAGYGAAFGLFPIGWIVFAAIFLYALTVDTGQFEIVKQSVLSLSPDRRLQALLIAFCFGAFIEGAAGFGTPVAISAALLMGAGFRPLHAAGLSLLANTSPVAFGALGTPILTLAKVTGLDAVRLSAMTGRQLPFFSLLVPVWLVWVMAGWRGVRGVWPALVVCGGSFALVQFLVANFHGPWLVDVAGGVVSLVCLAVFLRFWQPAEILEIPRRTPLPCSCSRWA